MRSASPTQGTTACIDDLPPALHLHALSFLPLVERVRCGLVARSWKALLADPVFWAELRFDGAAEGSVGNATLMQLCRRAGAGLRALDVASVACIKLTFNDVLRALSSARAGRALPALRVWAPSSPAQGLSISTTEAVTMLRAACPALTELAAEVAGDPERVTAILRALPAPRLTRVKFSYTAHNPGLRWADITDPLCTALAASCVDEIDLRFAEADAAEEEEDDTPTAAAAGREDAEEQQAALRLSAVLAAPRRGVRSLRLCGGSGGALLVPSLCRALTAESPLTELTLLRTRLTREGAAAVAALLAPARQSRLQTLVLDEIRGFAKADRRVSVCLFPHMMHCFGYCDPKDTTPSPYPPPLPKSTRRVFLPALATGERLCSLRWARMTLSRR